MLEVAARAFAAEGLFVSLDEIARRSGVGPGTVHRHFPTKESLVTAVLEGQVAELAERARALAASPDPGAAFYELFSYLAARGGESHALAARLDGGVDVAAAVAAPLAELRSALAALLRRAQRAGAVRGDVRAAEVLALLAGAHAIGQHPEGGEGGLALLCAALRPPRDRSLSRRQGNS